MMNKFSIVSVNFNSYDFAHLLIKTCNKFAVSPVEIVIIDNSEKRETLEYSNVSLFYQNSNIGHGNGLNAGVAKTTGDIVFILDIDCHLLCPNFEEILNQLLEFNEIVAVPGSLEKPLRPACLCMKKSLATTYDFASTPGYQGHRKTPDGYDVGILAYYQMLKEKRKIYWMDIHSPSRYKTLNGVEYCVGDKPLVYHHWHGTHLKERQIDFPYDNLIKDKEKLFNSVLDDC